MKKTLLFILAFTAALMAGAQTLTVATYNIRNENQGDYRAGNGWSVRLPLICEQVRMHGFDVFGAQEVLDKQLHDMLAGLPGYGYTGVGRDDGATKGEYSPIFYRADKLDLLRGDTFWLSTLTDKPNKGWDAALPRICSWGEFRERETGKVFFFFNTHFDHIGVEARRQSARLILEKVKEIAAGAPVILTGDFNVDQTSDSYAVFAASPLVKDCYGEAPVKFAPGGTFNSFDPLSYTASRIDHIFVSPATAVNRYGILTEIYWTPADVTVQASLKDAPAELKASKYVARTPSDHYPVMAVIAF